MRTYSIQKRSIRPDRLTRTLVVAFILLAGVTLVVAGYYLVSNGIIPILGAGQADAGDTNPSAFGGGAHSTWQGTARVTILVMGLDYRDWEADNKPHSDSMWLFTIDPTTKTAGMLSIPRDTWVNVPGYGESKINNAYFYGEVDGVDSGGPALAEKTVEEFLQIHIDYYAVVDFKAFTGLVDRLGGVTMNIPDTITVDPLGPGNTVVLKPGRQKLSGPVALAYARNRHTDGGDFDRMNRQGEVILALRDEILQPKTFAKLIAEAPAIYNILASNIHTDLTLQQAIQLAWLVKDIPVDQIHRGVIGPDEVTMTTSWQGWSILVPDMEKVREVRDRVFSAAQEVPSPSAPVANQEPPTAEGNPGPGAVEVQPAATETKSPADSTQALNPVKPRADVKILVENGTQTTGLARQTHDYLISLGYTVLDPADSENHYDQTAIIDYTGNPEMVAALAQALNVNYTHIFNGTGDGSADILIILGEDWARNNSLP